MTRDSSGSKAASRIVEEAMYECHAARELYLNQAAQGSERDIEVLREFHVRVMNYYFALRRLRGRSEVSEKWESARLFRPDRALPSVSGAQPAQRSIDAVGKDDDGWVYGLENLAPWSDKKIEGRREAPGRTSNTQHVTAPAILSPEDLMRVSGILDDLAEELNLSARPQAHNRPNGRVTPSQER